MKDEQQLHSASPESSLHHIVVKSDLKTRRQGAERRHIMFPDRRGYSQMGETTDEGDKSTGVKPDIPMRPSANKDSCASSIDCKIKRRL